MRKIKRKFFGMRFCSCKNGERAAAGYERNITVHSARINPRDLVVLPAKVLDELDKLKTSKDSELKGKAELALRKIKNAGKNRKIRYEVGAVELLPIDFNAKNADNIILSLAIKYRNQNAVLLTSDNGLISKAKAVRVNVKSLKEL